MPRWRDPRALLSVILAAACLLRLYKLTAFALWYDESVSFELSAYPWSEFFTRVRAEVGLTPLYFMVLKLWEVPFGRSLFALRSLSLVCGVLAVWLGYRFVREAFGQTRFALVAALLLAVNPFQIQYARETRMYAMGVCLVLLASSMLARALRTRQRRHWIAYGLAAAACLYTHYYLVFAVAAQALVAATLCLREPPPRRSRMFGSLTLAYVVTAAAFAPWIPTFVQQTRRVQQDFWIPQLTLERLLRVPWALVLGGSDSGWTPVTWLIAATIVLFMLLAAAVRQARGWADWLVISQAAFPIAAGLALSIVRPIFLDRYFLFASAFWSILIAGLIARLSRPDVRQAAAAFVVLLSVAALARNLNAIGLVSIRHPVEKPGMAGAAALVNREARGGDAIIVAHGLIYFPFKYYNRTIIQPSLYSTIPLERFPHYAGQALLDPAQMTYDLGTLPGPRRVWYLWTDGFYQKKFPVPANWRLQSTHRFDDTPGYKGSIVVDEYAIAQ